MTRRKKGPLRPLTASTRGAGATLSCLERASHVARAKALLAVADGQSYTAAARRSGDPSRDRSEENLDRAGLSLG